MSVCSLVLVLLAYTFFEAISAHHLLPGSTSCRSAKTSAADPRRVLSGRLDNPHVGHGFFLCACYASRLYVLQKLKDMALADKQCCANSVPARTDAENIRLFGGIGWRSVLELDCRGMCASRGVQKQYPRLPYSD